MKRIGFCLVALALLIGISVQDSAGATIYLTNLTKAYTGRPLSPTVVVSPAGTPYTLTGAPKTAVGSYPVKATINGTTVSATGTFKIYSPTGGFGGGSSGGGSEDPIWIFQGLWSGLEAATPSGAAYAPTSLSGGLDSLSLTTITVTAADINSPTGYYEYTLKSQLPLSLLFNSGGVQDLPLIDGSPYGTFTWDSTATIDSFQATFGFTIPGTGIPIYYVADDLSVPGVPDVLKVKYEFTAGSDGVSIERTWAIDYEHTCLSDSCAEKVVTFVETTPEPLPPIPLPDDLTVLSASYAKVAQTRLLLGWWAYKYKLNLQNGGTIPLANVCGKVKSTSSSVKIIDPEVCFPDIPAGGSATSQGTFSFTAKSPDISSLSWIYSSLKIAADPSGPVTEAGTHPLSYYVTLSTSAPKPYYVLFHQWTPVGVTVMPDAPLGWQTSEANTWTVTQDVTVPAAMTSEIKAGVWLLNTLQEAHVTVPIEVPAP
jgi:hypothetical protein